MIYRIEGPEPADCQHIGYARRCEGPNKSGCVIRLADGTYAAGSFYLGYWLAGFMERANAELVADAMLEIPGNYRKTIPA